MVNVIRTDVVRSSEVDKHLKKTGEHIGRNDVEIRIKMKTIVQKPLMIKSVMILLFIFIHHDYITSLLWLVFLFYNVSTLSGSFYAELRF